jgi:asparagine N-glycosylation enzyme membrane subunit Stt3
LWCDCYLCLRRCIVYINLLLCILVHFCLCRYRTKQICVKVHMLIYHTYHSLLRILAFCTYFIHVETYKNCVYICVLIVYMLQTCIYNCIHKCNIVHVHTYRCIWVIYVVCMQNLPFVYVYLHYIDSLKGKALVNGQFYHN